MSIKDFIEKIKCFWADFKDSHYSQEKGLKIKEDIYIAIMLILVATASYGLGKISAYEKNKEPISILKTRDSLYASVLESDSVKSSNTNVDTAASGEVVASKSGTKYYYPWCTGVSRIKEENKVWYKTIEEAKSAGLTPASNCVGLK